MNRDSNRRTLAYQANALPTELSCLDIKSSSNFKVSHSRGQNEKETRKKEIKRKFRNKRLNKKLYTNKQDSWL